MKCQYFAELCKIDPTLKNISTLEFGSMEHLINGLNNNILTVTFIEKLSKCFDWDYQEALITQVIFFFVKYLSAFQKKNLLKDYYNPQIAKIGI